jgi:hypothetical protein
VTENGKYVAVIGVETNGNDDLKLRLGFLLMRFDDR